MNERKTDKPAAMEPTRSTRGRSQARLGRDIQAKIGQQLRSYYDGLVEPPPERFVELLRQIDRQPDKESPE